MRKEVEPAGPYDEDVCGVCGKSAKDGLEHTAAFGLKKGGKVIDICQKCVKGDKHGQ